MTFWCKYEYTCKLVNLYVYCIKSCLRLFNYFVLSFDIIHSLSRVEGFCYIHIISEKNILTRILSIWEISRCECVRNLTQIYSQCFDRHYFKSCSNFKLWLHILFITFNKGVLKPDACEFNLIQIHRHKSRWTLDWTNLGKLCLKIP